MAKIFRRSILKQMSDAYDRFLDGTLLNAQLRTPSGKKAYVSFLSEQQRVPALDHQYEVLPAECYGSTLSFEEAVEAVRTERQYQDQKYGDQRPQSLPGYLLIMQREINEAIDGWIKDEKGRDSTLSEVVQVAATAIACIERYGDVGTAIPTNDVPYSQKMEKVTLTEGPTLSHD